MTYRRDGSLFLEVLRQEAAGALLITKRDGEEDIVFCGEQDGEGYVGWTPRERADANGWSYKAAPNLEIAALLVVTDLAWKAIAANYDTSGLDILGKAPLWDALADLESALREVGYVA